MGKTKTIDYFFKRKDDEQENKRHKASTSEPQPQEHEIQHPIINEAPQPISTNEVDLNHLERDPAKRKQMWEYPVNLREQQNEDQIRKNRLRLKTTVDVVRWLTFQACAFRGHDESSTSKNRGLWHYQY